METHRPCVFSVLVTWTSAAWSHNCMPYNDYNYNALGYMEPASTCFHYHHPQSITSLMKITNSEILLERIAVTGPHARLPSRGLALRASREGSQRGAKGDEGRGKGRLRHLGGAPFRGLAPPASPHCPGGCPPASQRPLGRADVPAHPPCPALLQSRAA